MASEVVEDFDLSTVQVRQPIDALAHWRLHDGDGLGRISGHERATQNDCAAKLFHARPHAYAHSSRTNFAATVAVIPLISRSGFSSTISAPTSGARCACSTFM